MNVSHVHDLLKESFFTLYRKPEQVRDLEIAASLMRSLQGVPESDVSSAGEFSKDILADESGERVEEFDGCRRDWLGRVLIAMGLEVPPSEREKSMAPGSVMTLVPLTPEIAKHTTFTRKSGNPWNPGAYVEGMILRGCTSSESANQCWRDLATAFSVIGHDADDRQDAWATVVEKAALCMSGEEAWSGQPSKPIGSSNGWAAFPGNWTSALLAYPPRSLADDISVLCRLESRVTRRTWIGIMDCYLRLAISADMLWIGRVNRGLESLIRNWVKTGGSSDPTDEHLAAEILAVFDPIEMGAHCESVLKHEVREFAKSQIFLTQFIGQLGEEHISAISESGGLTTTSGIIALLRIAKDLGPKVLEQADSKRSELIDEYPNMLSFKGSKTWTHQLYFALRYGLGQRSASEANRHFDQGYWCRKSGLARNHPWNFEMSPVGVTLMVHLVTARKTTATARDLQLKLADYGIVISMTELSRGAVGVSLRRLGLVTDSPDAEGGMVLRSPFLGRDPL